MCVGRPDPAAAEQRQAPLPAGVTLFKPSGLEVLEEAGGSQRWDDIFTGKDQHSHGSMDAAMEEEFERRDGNVNTAEAEDGARGISPSARQQEHEGDKEEESEDEHMVDDGTHSSASEHTTPLPPPLQTNNSVINIPAPDEAAAAAALLGARAPAGGAMAYVKASLPPAVTRVGEKQQSAAAAEKASPAAKASPAKPAQHIHQHPHHNHHNHHNHHQQGDGHAALKQVPEWLRVLTTSTAFFTPCPRCSPYHSGRDALLTFFDLETPHRPLCSFCKAALGSRRLVQVRRSTYHDVVKTSDVARLVDTTDVQTYVINGAKVVFLAPRPQPRPPKGSTMPAACVMDGRQLMDAGSLYCSLRCKVDASTGVAPSYTPAVMAAAAGAKKPRKRSSPASSKGAPKPHHHSPSQLAEQRRHAELAQLLAHGGIHKRHGGSQAHGALRVDIPSWGVRVKRFNRDFNPGLGSADNSYDTKLSPSEASSLPHHHPLAVHAKSYNPKKMQLMKYYATSSSSRRKSSHPMRSPEY